MRLFFPGPDGAAASGRLFDPIRSCGVSATGVPGNDKPMSVYVCLPIGAGRRCLSCLLIVSPFLVPRAHAIKVDIHLKSFSFIYTTNQQIRPDMRCVKSACLLYSVGFPGRGQKVTTTRARLDIPTSGYQIDFIDGHSKCHVKNYTCWKTSAV